MEGSSAENTNGVTDADGASALAPKKRSPIGIPLIVLALLVVVGFVLRSRGRKRGPKEPPDVLETAEPSGESGGGEPKPDQPGETPPPIAESVSVNGTHESGEHD